MYVCVYIYTVYRPNLYSTPSDHPLPQWFASLLVLVIYHELFVASLYVDGGGFILVSDRHIMIIMLMSSIRSSIGVCIPTSLPTCN